MGTYMEKGSYPERYNIQECIDSQWETIASNVGLEGYLFYLRTQGDNPVYRAVDHQGNVVKSLRDKIEAVRHG